MDPNGGDQALALVAQEASLEPMVAAGGGDAALAQAVSDDMEPLLLSDYIRLDYLRISNKTVLTDIISDDQHALDGEWVLEFAADDSAGCVANEDGDEVRFLDSIFQRLIVKDGAGQLFALTGGQALNLTAEMRKYTESAVEVSSPRPVMKFSLVCYILKRKKCGFHTWRSLTAAYKVLNLKSFKGFPSKWVYSSFPSWANALLKMGLEEHIMLSCGGLSQEDFVATTCRFLPMGAASLVGLVWLLARMGLLPGQQGGLRDDGDQASARNMLDCFLHACLRDGEAWSIRIGFDDGWVFRPPRPRPEVAPDMQVDLPIGDDLRIDLSAWGEMVAGGDFNRGHCILKWWRALHSDRKEGENCSLASLLRAALRSKVTEPLFAQLLWAIGDRIESQTMAEDPATQSIVCNETTLDMLQGTGKVASSFDVDIGASDQTEEDIRAEQEARHRVWLKRSASSENQSWRPVKKYRKSSCAWLQHLDNQVAIGTGMPGLKYWHHPDPEEEPDAEKISWRDAPHLLVVADQGGDGMSACHAAMYYKKIALNISVHFDPAHGSWRDIQSAIKSSGLYQWVLLALVMMNLAHGPELSDMRYSQFRDAMHHCRSHHTPESCELFKARASAMKAELGDAVLYDDDLTELESLWSYTMEHCMYLRKGYKINLNRFHAFVHECTTVLKEWHLRLFQTEYVSLEMDFVGNKALRERLLGRVGGADPAAAGAASTRSCGIEDKALRSCAQNSVTIALLFLSDTRNRQVMHMVMHLSKPVMDWHTTAERDTRTVDDASKWLRSQVDGRFFHHLVQLWRSVSDPDFMEGMGLLDFAKESQESLADEVILEDEEKTRMAGKYAMSLLNSRLRRAMWMLANYPVSLCRIVSDNASARQRALEQLKTDYEEFLTLQRMDRPPVAHRAFLERSSFNLVAVKVVVQAFVESNWTLTPEIREMLLNRTKGVISTQCVEDVNNFMKNDKSKPGNLRFRRPQCSMASAIAGQVLSSVHKYDEVSADACLPRRSVALDKGAFEGRGEDSLKFGSIVNTTQKAPYWSPTAINVGLLAADAAWLRTARKTPERSMPIANAWKGFFCDAGHSLCFRIKYADGEPSSWYFGLSHYDTSSCLAWPVRVRNHESYPDMQWIRPENIAEPQFVVVTELSEVEAFEVQWRSWAWQRKHVPLITGPSTRPAVRCFRSSAIGPVLSLAARSAWWNVSKSTLDTLARHLAVELPPNPDLFEILFALTKHQLGIEDTEVMDVLQQRMALGVSKNKFSEDLMQIDEATACLDYNDRDEIRKEQQKAGENTENHNRFVKQFREKRQSIPQRGPRGGVSRKKRALTWKGPTALPDPSAIAQSSVRNLVPPGASIWKANASGSWNAKLPPFSQISRSWTKYGEPEAIRLCLRGVWQQYLEANGYEESECPISGLF